MSFASARSLVPTSQRRFPSCHSYALHPVYCFSFFFPSLNNDGRNKRHPVWTIVIIEHRKSPSLSTRYLDRRSRMATFIRRARFPVRRRYSESHFFTTSSRLFGTIDDLSLPPVELGDLHAPIIIRANN